MRTTDRYRHGPSPRVRGSPDHRRAHGGWLGSIPACAGKPAAPRRAAGRGWVHPRVCGEAATVTCRAAVATGPSPRVRGSPDRAARPAARHGSIPACAGKPGTASWPRSGRRVHPRVCGEASWWVRSAHQRPGPSPRVRGSPRVAAHGGASAGSIPACAGKPASPWPAASPCRVHPRVCGEAIRQRWPGADEPGPSPRVRGSLYWDDLEYAGEGSIPACAGKPSRAGRRWQTWRVHPRVCGEAPYVVAGNESLNGPSPRVRGSRRGALGQPRRPRSIPACAGKPPESASRSGPRQVHPRVCGEASWVYGRLQLRKGPSPRVRGSRRTAAGGRQPPGSIPACAGKPDGQHVAAGQCRVHPRVCGEARTGVTDGSSP